MKLQAHLTAAMISEGKPLRVKTNWHSTEDPAITPDLVGHRAFADSIPCPYCSDHEVWLNWHLAPPITPQTGMSGLDCQCDDGSLTWCIPGRYEGTELVCYPDEVPTYYTVQHRAYCRRVLYVHVKHNGHIKSSSGDNTGTFTTWNLLQVVQASLDGASAAKHRVWDPVNLVWEYFECTPPEGVDACYLKDASFPKTCPPGTTTAEDWITEAPLHSPCGGCLYDGYKRTTTWFTPSAWEKEKLWRAIFSGASPALRDGMVEYTGEIGDGAGLYCRHEYTDTAHGFDKTRYYYTPYDPETGCTGESECCWIPMWDCRASTYGKYPPPDKDFMLILSCVFYRWKVKSATWGCVEDEFGTCNWERNSAWTVVDECAQDDCCAVTIEPGTFVYDPCQESMLALMEEYTDETL